MTSGLPFFAPPIWSCVILYTAAIFRWQVTLRRLSEALRSIDVQALTESSEMEIGMGLEALDGSSAESINSSVEVGSRRKVLLRREAILLCKSGWLPRVVCVCSSCRGEGRRAQSCDPVGVIEPAICRFVHLGKGTIPHEMTPNDSFTCVT